MDFISIQRCVNSGVYEYVQVASKSDSDRTYSVLVIDVENPEEGICECEGFNFRGTCKHLAIAAENVCGWNELLGPEEQAGDQRRNKICPRCGGETEWVTITDG